MTQSTLTILLVLAAINIGSTVGILAILATSPRWQSTEATAGNNSRIATEGGGGGISDCPGGGGYSLSGAIPKDDCSKVTSGGGGPGSRDTQPPQEVWYKKEAK